MKQIIKRNPKQDKDTPNQKSPDGFQLQPAAAAVDKNGSDFAVSADEVARRAYFSYLNEDSAPGQDVQHWLKAEAELIAERNLTRVHGFHNHT